MLHAVLQRCTCNTRKRSFCEDAATVHHTAVQLPHNDFTGHHVIDLVTDKLPSAPVCNDCDGAPAPVIDLVSKDISVKNRVMNSSLSRKVLSKNELLSLLDTMDLPSKRTKLSSSCSCKYCNASTFSDEKELLDHEFYCSVKAAWTDPQSDPNHNYEMLHSSHRTWSQL
jgi:hypothetical protein